MDTLSAIYRAFASRTGRAELVFHAAALSYALLLFTATVLNIFAPTWVSRNVAPVQPVSVPVSPFSTTQRLVPLQMHPPSPGDNPQKALSRCLSRGLLLDLQQDPVVERVRSEMDCGCELPEVYEPHETPNVCAIVQSFNHEANIEKIAHSLKTNPAIQEIIVCEDGSTDRSLEKWNEQLRDVKTFLVLSNNLHEVRCYNRAMRMSSADFFILLQDDDLPPPAVETNTESQVAVRDNWVSHALLLFDADPKLGVLSGFIGQLWADGVGYEFGEQTSDHGGTRKGKTMRIPFLSSRTLNPFMYAECAWAAPLFVRGDALRRIGGLDVGLFRVREPGVWQDCVLSYASWTAGWRVGVFDAGFKRGVGGHGSTSSPQKTKMRGVIWKRAKDACDSRYDRKYIYHHVLTLNSETLLRRFDNISYRR